MADYFPQSSRAIVLNRRIHLIHGLKYLTGHKDFLNILVEGYVYLKFFMKKSLTTQWKPNNILLG